MHTSRCCKSQRMTPYMPASSVKLAYFCAAAHLHKRRCHLQQDSGSAARAAHQLLLRAGGDRGGENALEGNEASNKCAARLLPSSTCRSFGSSSDLTYTVSSTQNALASGTDVS